MATFLMFGKYSADSTREIGAERTKKAAALIKEYGGEVKDMYAMLGEKDLLLIADFPGTQDAMKASVALSRMTGVSFTTAPAVSVAVFDDMME